MAEHATSTESATAQDSGDHGQGKPRYDDINTPVVVLVGILSTIVTIAIIAAVQGLCYQWENAELSKKSVVSWPAAQQIADQKAMLEGGDESISIGSAMEKVIASYGSSEGNEEEN